METEEKHEEEWRLLKCLRRRSALALLTVRNAILLRLDQRALEDLIRRKEDEMGGTLKSEKTVWGGSGRFGDHGADAADAVVFAEEAAGILSTLRERLQAVQDARAKIGEGIYGICEGCGGIIEAEVLRVCPETKLCWVCKLAKR